MGVELAPALQMIKKLKMDHLWVYTIMGATRSKTSSDSKRQNVRIPLDAATATDSDKKKTTTTKKKGMPVTEILNKCIR